MMHTWAHSMCQPDYNSMYDLAFERRKKNEWLEATPATVAEERKSEWGEKKIQITQCSIEIDI